MQKKTKNNIEAILFDLDGTFIDTSEDMCNALNLVLKNNQMNQVLYKDLKYHVSKGADGIIQFGFGNRFNQIRKDQLKKDFLSAYKQNICVHTHLINGMEELVEKIESKQVPWGIVTNKRSEFATIILSKLGYLKRLGCLITSDMVPNAKPDPDCLILASDKLNKNPKNIIYVGDDRRDILAGKKAGMTTVVANFGFILSYIPNRS